MHGIDGKVVAITGGARGIGYAIAKRLIADGASVAIGDIDDVQLKQAAADLGVATYAHLDVTDPTSFTTFLDRVERDLGPLDVLVNNAGIMPIGHFHQQADDATRRVVEINVLGAMYGSRLALTRMLPRRTGHIVNIASLAGESYIPGAATYCATKHALKGFTESLRREYRNSGVHLSSVLPTFVNTEMVAGAGKPKLLRNAEPEEIAAAVARLITHPRPQVRVTRIAGLVTASQNYLPRPILEPLLRLLGVEQAFLGDADLEGRRAYNKRLGMHFVGRPNQSH